MSLYIKAFELMTRYGGYACAVPNRTAIPFRTRGYLNIVSDFAVIYPGSENLCLLKPQYMVNSHASPWQLKAVAYLYFFQSISPALSILLSLLNSRLHIDLGVLLFFVGTGLLKHKLSAYKWAMFFTRIGLVVMPIAAVVFLFNPGDIRVFGQIVVFKVLGQTIGPAPSSLGSLAATIVSIITYWQYTVLTNQQVKRLFGTS